MSTSSNVGLLALSLAAAAAVPVVLGSVYSAWRASVTQELPPYDPGVAAAPAPEAPAEPREPIWAREVDAVVFPNLEGRIPDTARREDIAPDTPWRVDLLRGEASPKVNEVLVDLDRDGNWDERWTVAPRRGVLREVSPDDDGVYSQSFHWKLGVWELVEPDPGPE